MGEGSDRTKVSESLLERVAKLETQLKQEKSGWATRLTRIGAILGVFATLLSLYTVTMSLPKTLYEAQSYFLKHPELSVSNNPKLTLRFNPRDQTFAAQFKGNVTNNTEWATMVSTRRAEITCPVNPGKQVVFNPMNISMDSGGNRVTQLSIPKATAVPFDCEINGVLNNELKAVLMQEDTRRKLTVIFSDGFGTDHSVVFWYDLMSKQFFQPKDNREQTFTTEGTQFSNEDK
jgi:hypothetical protein